ncbi:MAG TPA: AsmA family protein [Fluviicoccus sp.]|nr:AsmA family protein [Fluviicoccus sp.]
MSRALKSLGIVAAALIGLVLLLVTYILFFINPNDYKGEIAKVVKDKTDMDLVMADPLSWQLWPRISLHLGKTTLTDTQAGKTLVAINQADVSVQVMPLLAKKIAIDEVRLDGAKLDFVQYANGTTSWDRMLAKLKSAPEEKSEKIDFNISLLDISNSALHFKDEKGGLDGNLDKLLVQASNIDLKKAFPVRVKFTWAQTDAQGKTLTADNDLNATVQLDQDAEKYLLKNLAARSHLAGSLLPAPVVIDVSGDVSADMKQQLHTVDALKLAVDYQDPALSKPAHVELTGKVNADMKAQKVAVSGLALSASYPQAGLKSPATVKMSGDVQADLAAQVFNLPAFTVDAAYPAANLSAPATVKLTAAIVADLKQQLVSLSGIKAAASYPETGRPAPITADLSGAISANLASGAVSFSPLDVSAQVSDKAFPKVMPVHLVAPITANWKEGKVALNGFTLDALSIQTKGQISASLPGIAATAKPGTPATQGMTLSGNIATSPFNLRQLMQTLGMAAPVMADSSTLQRVSVSTQISGNENSILLKGLNARLDDSTLTGEAGLTDLKTGKIYARLNVDKINVDRYLPPVDPNAKPAPAAKTAEGLLPVELLKKQNLDVGLTIGSLTVMKYPVQKLQLTATAKDGVVNVSQLGGSVMGGRFSFPTTIDVRGAKPVLTVTPSVEQMQVENVVQQFTKKDLLAGIAAFNGTLKMSGNSVDEWLGSLNGASKLSFNNGLLKGVNMMQLVTTEMGKYQALLPFITGKDAATLVSKQNNTEIANFLGEASISNGTVQNKALNADLKKAKVTGTGTFSLVSQQADYSFNLTLDKSIVGESLAGYAFPIRCKGKVTEIASLCSVDGKAVRDMAGKALLNSKEVQKVKAELAAKEDAARAELAKKQAEAEAAAKARIEEEKKKAQEKVNQKLNEGLQKLFNR